MEKLQKCGGAGRLSRDWRLGHKCQKQDDEQPEQAGDDKFSNNFFYQDQTSTFIAVVGKTFRFLEAFFTTAYPTRVQFETFF